MAIGSEGNDSGSSGNGGNGGGTMGDQTKAGFEALGLETSTQSHETKASIIGEDTPVEQTAVEGGDDGANMATDGSDRLAPGDLLLAPELTPAEASSTAVVVTGEGDGGSGAGEAMGEKDRLAPDPERLAPVMAPAEASPAAAVAAGGDGGGSSGTGTTMEGGSSGRGKGDILCGNRGDEGNDDSGRDESETVRRDPSRGKQPADIGDAERQGPQEGIPNPSTVAFIAPTGSSAQQLVYYADFAEFVGEEQLAQLGQTNRGLLEAVLRMRQEHVENHARRDEEIRLVMEHEASLRRRENVEREHQATVVPRVSAVREAERQGDPGMTEGVPNLPEAHLVVLRGFKKYDMKWQLYSDDQAFRDREHHLRTSWAEV